MKLRNILLLFLAALLAISCEKDNYDAPQSKLTGRLVYNGQAIGLRSGGVSFELWQHGYKLFSKIPLNIAQDGSFSAVLFDGDYKLVRSVGSGPWLDVTDSIDVSLKGASTIDVPIQPYYFIKDVAFEKVATELKATFTVQAVNTTKTLEYVRLFLGPNYILDVNNNSGNKQAGATTINITQPVTLSLTIPAALANENYLYARVAVKTSGIAELLYSPSTKVQLK